MHHNIFALFFQKVYAIEMLLAGFNVQLRIGMNQSLIVLRLTRRCWWRHMGTYSIQHLSAQLVKFFGLFLCLNCGVYDTISATEFIDFFLIKSNWLLQYFDNKRQI